MAILVNCHINRSIAIAKNVIVIVNENDILVEVMRNVDKPTPTATRTIGNRDRGWGLGYCQNLGASNRTPVSLPSTQTARHE